MKINDKKEFTLLEDHSNDCMDILKVKYDFKYDKYKVNNIYKQWKKNTIKLTKYIIFEKKILQIIIMKFI